MTRQVLYPHPGEILAEEFLAPGLQSDYDTAMAKDAIEPELATIEPLALAA